MKVRVAFVLCSVLFASSAVAAPDAEMRACFYQASERYEIDSRLLKAIAEVESGFRADAVNSSNRNGTRDVGIMQINSWWFPKLEKEYGITESDLFDPCTNIHVGAWILANNFNDYGWTWESIGAYNVGMRPGKVMENLRRSYAERVYAALENY